MEAECPCIVGTGTSKQVVTFQMILDIQGVEDNKFDVQSVSLLYICVLGLVHFNLGRKKFREQLFEHFKVQNSQHGGRPRDGGGGPQVGPDFLHRRDSLQMGILCYIKYKEM
jgi:hypothetical protein